MIFQSAKNNKFPKKHLLATLAAKNYILEN